MHKIPNTLGVLLSVVLCATLFQPSSAEETAVSVAHLENNTVINSYVSTTKPKITLNRNNVVIESDGSLTPKEERIVDVLAAFQSSVGAAVNMELVFAKNSIVLTAEGQETLGLIADAIRYQDVDTAVDLEFPSDSSTDKRVIQRRADEVLRRLKSQHGLRNPLRVFITKSVASKKLHSIKGNRKGTDVQRLTFLNMGRSG